MPATEDKEESEFLLLNHRHGSFPVLHCFVDLEETVDLHTAIFFQNKDQDLVGWADGGTALMLTNKLPANGRGILVVKKH